MCAKWLRGELLEPFYEITTNYIFFTGIFYLLYFMAIYVYYINMNI